MRGLRSIIKLKVKGAYLGNFESVVEYAGHIVAESVQPAVRTPHVGGLTGQQSLHRLLDAPQQFIPLMSEKENNTHKYCLHN